MQTSRARRDVDGWRSTPSSAAARDLTPGEQLDVLRVIPRVSALSCPALWEGDPGEAGKARDLQSRWTRRPKTWDNYLDATRDCALYRRRGGFELSSVSEEELSFPLAFSILVHRDADQVLYYVCVYYVCVCV